MSRWCRWTSQPTIRMATIDPPSSSSPNILSRASWPEPSRTRRPDYGRRPTPGMTRSGQEGNVPATSSYDRSKRSPTNRTTMNPRPQTRNSRHSRFFVRSCTSASRRPNTDSPVAVPAESKPRLDASRPSGPRRIEDEAPPAVLVHICTPVEASEVLLVNNTLVEPEAASLHRDPHRSARHAPVVPAPAQVPDEQGGSLAVPVAIRVSL